MSFNVIFFNRSFYPDVTASGQLLTQLCESLVKNYGCRVCVVAGRPLNVLANDFSFNPDRMIENQYFNGIKILRLRSSAFSHKSFSGRILNYLTYFLFSIFVSFKLKTPDLIVCLTDPPIIPLVGVLISRRFNIPFIISMRDIFPEASRGLKGAQSKIINFILDRINRYCLKKADHIVTLGELMRKKIAEEKGISQDKLSVIPDWADCQEIFPVSKRNPFSIQHGIAEAFVVMYSGNLGVSSGLETLMEALNSFKECKDIVFVLIGEGIMKDKLVELARKSDFKNIKFLSYQSRKMLAYSFSSADLFVISLRKGLAGYSVPSKIYGILASGRPYVACIEEEGELGQITRRFDCGVLARPDDPEDLTEKIFYFYKNRELLRRMGENARRAALLFDRKIGVDSYYRLFKQLNNGKKNFLL